MKVNDCPDCRAAMRLWALDWRRAELENKPLCLRVALDFRSGTCYHATTACPSPYSVPTPSDFVRHLASNLSTCSLRNLAEARRLGPYPPEVFLSNRLRAIGVGKAQIERGLQAEASAALECIRAARGQSRLRTLPPAPGEFGERSARIVARRAGQVRGGETAGSPDSSCSPAQANATNHGGKS